MSVDFFQNLQELLVRVALSLLRTHFLKHIKNILELLHWRVVVLGVERCSSVGDDLCLLLFPQTHCELFAPCETWLGRHFEFFILLSRRCHILEASLLSKRGVDFVWTYAVLACKRCEYCVFEWRTTAGGQRQRNIAYLKSAEGFII